MYPFKDHQRTTVTFQLYPRTERSILTVSWCIAVTLHTGKTLNNRDVFSARWFKLRLSQINWTSSNVSNHQTTILSLEQKMIQEETSQAVSEFLNANDDQQRHLFDEPVVSSFWSFYISIEQEKGLGHNSRFLWHYRKCKEWQRADWLQSCPLGRYLGGL